MFSNKDQFKSEYEEMIIGLFAKPIPECGKLERYEALVRLITDKAAKLRAETVRRYEAENKKEVYYFSMEFLIGKLLRNYLINTGGESAVSSGLKDFGIDLNDLYLCEKDPGLGNGGLGRLAACFMDSMALQGINAVGNGIRFRFGLFRQRIESGWQREDADVWLDNGFPWETKKPDEAVTVNFGGTVDRVVENGRETFRHRNYYSVKAVPYDVPMVGPGAKNINTLRLWRALPQNENIDLDAFANGDYSYAMRSDCDAQAISCVLYPDDSRDAGKELRLKQEYFFVAAGIESILKKYKAKYGTDQWEKFPDRVSIHINDTHPALCIPELMRRFVDDENLDWDVAWKITENTVSYTNHTVLPEALEKWPVGLFRGLLPRIYMITEEIDRRYRLNFDRTRPRWANKLEATAVIGEGQVRMANLSILGSHSINGVAAIHTDILKTVTLKDFYTLTPEKFNNKTNGVSHRRFLIESNPGLAGLITSSIGDNWISNPFELEKLLQYNNNSAFLDDLRNVKLECKRRLSDYIAEKTHIKVDPYSVFDVQTKRLHAYKRQLLNVFKIMDIYNRLKENPNMDILPHTFIFAGKAAKSYVFAKETIKLICSVADVVNADPDMEGKLKVVFLENFNVSLGQIIYPAADISEQISTAGKEASGTGNMKFMMNGAVTLGTLDGANVEIKNLVGDDNIVIFGLNAEEALSCRCSGNYEPFDECEADPRLKLITQQLVNGFFRNSGHDFWCVYEALFKEKDEFLVLKDFAPYVSAWEHMSDLYRDNTKWWDMSLTNIAKSGYFSSDRTIAEYAKDIWHV